MFISSVIPTIGRPSLARAVTSVLQQKFDHENFEVIVVNDSGRDLPEEGWQKHSQVKIIHTNRHNRSIARNTGAAIASGRFFHFLDDDDYIYPGAFSSFREAAKNSSAGWIYGGFQLVDNSGKKIADIFPDEDNNCMIQLLAWEWIPLQSSIINANAFFRVGGFAMLESLLGGFEDIDLSRQIALYYDFVSIPRLIACIRHGDVGSTTNYVNMFLQNRHSREKTLRMDGAFTRTYASARNSKTHKPYWFGRACYYYLGSVIRNLKDKRIFTALSRLLSSILLFLASSRYLLSKEYWDGMTKPHHNRVWNVLSTNGENLFTETNFKY